MIISKYYKKTKYFIYNNYNYRFSIIKELESELTMKIEEIDINNY